MGEGVVEQDRRRGAFGAQEPDELEPLHEIRLPLRPVRQGGEVDDLAALGRLEADAEIVLHERGRVPAAGQPADRLGERRSQERGDVAIRLVGGGRELGLGEPEHGVDVLEVGDALGRLLELLAELGNPGGGLLPLGEPGLERGGADGGTIALGLGGGPLGLDRRDVAPLGKGGVAVQSRLDLAQPAPRLVE